MYIIKNALRNINRSKGRNFLIGIIVVVISLSTCLSLSIRASANTAKEETLDGMSITAQISYDRSSMMKQAMENASSDGGSAPSKDDMRDLISGASGLSLDELQTYAKAKSVNGFYYNMKTSVDASDNIEAVNSSDDTETDEESTSSNNSQSMPADMESPKGKMASQGDFTIIGYNDEDAMVDFQNGTSTISDGSIFEEGTAENDCVISDELALLNSIKIGDTITLVNPNNEDETIVLNVVGTYTNSSSTSAENGMMGFSASSDPANEIYMSYTALNAITEKSETTNEDDTSNALTSQISGTYTFATIDDYNNFESQARELGLADEYTVSSTDVESYENSLIPLENLSKYATYFLVVVLVIGAIILVVLNIFNVRERKYEIGVLTAIGMKKKKVATQFIVEIFTVTFVAMLIGIAVGSPLSVPVTNALLKEQVTAQNEQVSQTEQNFGRGGNMVIADDSSSNSSDSSSSDSSQTKNAPNGFMGMATNYITEVDSAVNLTVIFELIGIGIILTIISSTFAVIFVMRYDPLKILSERD